MCSLGILSQIRTYIYSYCTGSAQEAHPCLTERLLMGRKESNQTNIHIVFYVIFHVFHQVIQ